MIQVGSFDTKGKPRPKPPVVFSSLSLDRASKSPLLVVAEYNKDCQKRKESKEDRKRICRVIRFALPEKPADLPTRGARKPLPAHDAYRYFYDSVQGAVSHDGKFWFASSSGEIHNDSISDHYGTLRVWSPRDKKKEDVRHYPWAYGAEGITYRHRGGNTGEIVTVTEYSHYRMIAAVDSKHFS